MHNIFYHNINQNIISKFYLNARNIYKTHYEILNVQKNSSPREIKDAYIKLSKQYHPDLNKNEANHTRFVQISEAYNILSKPDTRRYYDLGLSSSKDANVSNSSTQYDYQRETGRSPWDDPSFYTNRDKAQDNYYTNKPYYGIKGVNKVSNFSIVVLCILLTAIGVSFQIWAIRNSLTLRRGQLINNSIMASESLAKSKSNAEINGNKVQLELLKRKMMENGSYEK